MGRYYNKEGKEIDQVEWVKLFGNFEYTVIKQEILPNGKWVSTVWLGLNHNFGEGKPLIFETMVFPKKGNYRDLDQARHSTLKEAKKGHKEMVNKYKQ